MRPHKWVLVFRAKTDSLLNRYECEQCKSFVRSESAPRTGTDGFIIASQLVHNDCDYEICRQVIRL